MCEHLSFHIVYGLETLIWLCIVLLYLHAKFGEQIRDMAKIWFNEKKIYTKFSIVVAMLLLKHHSNSPIFVAIIMVMVIMLLWL